MATTTLADGWAYETFPVDTVWRWTVLRNEEVVYQSKHGESTASRAAAKWAAIRWIRATIARAEAQRVEHLDRERGVIRETYDG